MTTTMLRKRLSWGPVAALLLMLSPAQALPQASVGGWYESWRVDVVENKTYAAATFSESGALLGQFCYPNLSRCIWSIGLPTACKKGNKYPVLANTDSGATSLSVVCDGVIKTGAYRYSFSDFAAVTQVLEKSSRVGFAFPLQSDQFTVVRFRLEGMEAALGVIQGGMRAAMNQKNKEAEIHGDQIL